MNTCAAISRETFFRRFVETYGKSESKCGSSVEMHMRSALISLTVASIACRALT